MTREGNVPSISSRSPGTAGLVDRLNRSYYHGSGHSSGMFVAVKGAVPLRRFLVRLLGTDIYWLA